MIEALYAEVEHLADGRTPDVFERVFDRLVPTPFCNKCQCVLRAYIKTKIALHHLKRAMHNGISGVWYQNAMTREAGLADESFRLRHEFYNTPCLCGQREEYVYQCK